MISKADRYPAEYFEKMLKRSFEAGNKSVLLYTIYACLESGQPAPKWLRAAFMNAYEAAVFRFEIRSWDEVFGRPVAKGAHLPTERKRARLRWTIIERVKALKAGGKRIDKDLFEKVGKELKISGTTASDIYYDEQSRWLRRDPRSDLRR